MSQPFRFVHASDFHLEKPLRTSTDAPEQFASLLVETRYRAAQRVFDLALTSRADFLILAGDIVQVAQGQFDAIRRAERVDEHRHLRVGDVGSDPGSRGGWPTVRPGRREKGIRIPREHQGNTKRIR